MRVYTDLSNKRRLGKVVKLNNKTIWLRIMIGAIKSIVVKRHINKHHVRFYNEDN